MSKAQETDSASWAVESVRLGVLCGFTVLGTCYMQEVALLWQSCLEKLIKGQSELSLGFYSASPRSDPHAILSTFKTDSETIHKHKPQASQQ